MFAASATTSLGPPGRVEGAAKDAGPLLERGVGVARVEGSQRSSEGVTLEGLSAASSLASRPRPVGSKRRAPASLEIER